MRVADFFCGGGGFSEGFRQAGFDIVFGVDIWQPAVETFRENKHLKNSNSVLNRNVIELSNLPDDIFDCIIPDTEVIIGSPPCVAFSNSNKSGNGDKELGLQLLNAYLKIIYRKKYKKNSVLKYWVLENVPNVKEYIKDVYTAADFDLLGDEVLTVINQSSHVYNAKYYGAPTNRKRFLCGEFPEPIQTHDDTNLIPLKAILACLGEPSDMSNRKVKDCNYPDLKMKRHQISDHLYVQKLQKFEWVKAKRLKTDRGYMGKMAFPEDIEKPARTVMATMSPSSREAMILGMEDGQYRLPTIREVACMMSFPLDYKFYGDSIYAKYKLVGNAVPPKLSYAIACAILREENMHVPDKYIRINHLNRIPFYNLNGITIPLKVEKKKRINAKFKYHIPYTIEKAFRVELTNYHSDFKNEVIRWNAEIHFSQGKEKARCFRPNLDLECIPDSIVSHMFLFVDKVTENLLSENQLQELFRMTEDERNGRDGPYEILDKVKIWLDTVCKEQEWLKVEKNVISFNYEKDKKNYNIPIKIYMGYILLNIILFNIKKNQYLYNI